MTSETEDFRALFDASYPKLMAYARRRVEPSVADDVVSETFLVAWRRRAEFLALEAPLPWLYSVAGNQLRNQTRGSNRHLRLVAKAASEPSESAKAADHTMAAQSEAEMVRQALSTLSFDDQEVLRLVTWEDLSYAQAAETLECSTDALAQRLRRAKQRLGQALERLQVPQSPSSDLPIAEVQ